VEIVIHTQPNSAMLYLDGKLLRRTGGKPGNIRLVPSGRQRFLRVMAPGFNDKRVGFVADQDRELKIKLDN
jgi:hypothetical protein